MPATLSIPDKRMLQLIDLLKSNETIRFTQQFCDTIGILKQNIRSIKIGKQHFTTAQIEITCKKYKVNANWIFGFEKVVFRQ